MRTLKVVAALLGLAVSALAQRHRVDINAETPEGQLLQQIGQEEDEAKKLGLLEQFIAKFPKHEGAAWAYELMIPAYTKAGQFDKAMEAGEKLLALDPQDAESAHASLKAAEAKKDPDAVLKWAVLTSEAARKVAQLPKPKEEDEVEAWTRRVDYAKQVDVYTEYSLYAMALQVADPRKKIALGDMLEQRNPASQYLPQLGQVRFVAYIQAGENQKALALAEKIIEKDQTNEDMMLAVADGYKTASKEPDKVVALCAKVLELVATKPKPEGISEADWAARKVQITGRAYYLTGVTYAVQSKFEEADKALRAALPGIKDSQFMLGEALFHLGVANFRLGEKGDPNRIVDAVRFNEQCVAIAGPYQAMARKNLNYIRSQYRLVK